MYFNETVIFRSHGKQLYNSLIIFENFEHTYFTEMNVKIKQSTFIIS